VSCSLINPLSYGACAGSIAKSVAGDAFDSIAKSFGHAAQSATGWLWAQINAATAVRLGGAGFSTVLDMVAAIAGTVAVGLFVIQIIQSLLRREPAGLGRAIRGLLVAFIAGGAAVAVVNLLLGATDALCDGVVQTAVGTDPAGLGRLVLGSTATAALVGLVSGPGGAAGVLLLALAILVAVVIVYVALVIRKVLIVVTAVFAPLAFAGSLADITLAWTRRWIEFTLALIFSKLILILIFVIGYFMLIKGVGQAGTGVTQEITQVVSGVIVLALAGFAPWLALKVVHFTGDHASQLHALSATTAGGAMAVGRMGQKAVPAMGAVTSKLSAGSGNDTTNSETAGSSTPPAQHTPPSGPAAGDAPGAPGNPGTPGTPGTPGGPGASGGPSTGGNPSPAPGAGSPNGAPAGAGPSSSPPAGVPASGGPAPGPAAAPVGASAGGSAGGAAAAAAL
jgi:type IV secretion system protein TrbL